MQINLLCCYAFVVDNPAHSRRGCKLFLPRSHLQFLLKFRFHIPRENAYEIGCNLDKASYKKFFDCLFKHIAQTTRIFLLRTAEQAQAPQGQGQIYV